LAKRGLDRLSLATAGSNDFELASFIKMPKYSQEKTRRFIETFRPFGLDRWSFFLYD
jgi:hypothetical protein